MDILHLDNYSVLIYPWYIVHHNITYNVIWNNWDILISSTKVNCVGRPILWIFCTCTVVCSDISSSIFPIITYNVLHNNCLTKLNSADGNIFCAYSIGQILLEKYSIGEILEKYSIGEIFYWRNILLEKYSIGEIFYWRNILLQKYSVAEILYWRNILLEKYSIKEIFYWRNILFEKYSIGEIFCWRNIILEKYSVGDILLYRYSIGEIFSWRHYMDILLLISYCCESVIS